MKLLGFLYLFVAIGLLILATLEALIGGIFLVLTLLKIMFSVVMIIVGDSELKTRW